MRKIIKLIVLTILLSVFSFLVINIISKSKEKNSLIKRLQTIPEFQLSKLDNTKFSNSNLELNKATVFIYFNSECEFCQYEAEEIYNNLDSLTKAQFLFVSKEDKEIIKQFSENYNLHNQSNITFLHDTESIFSSEFDAKTTPYILIYNKEKKVIQKYNGQLSANEILKALNK